MSASSHLRRPSRIRFLPLLALGLLPPLVALAEEIEFGPQDIATVFFIDKSDDGSRVDYGMRLSPGCYPKEDEPIFPYWREFDPPPPVRTHGLKFYEYLAYGVSEQEEVRRGPNGVEFRLRLKQIDRDLFVTTSRQPDGKCKATVRTRVGKVADAELLSAHVTVGSPVKVEIRGRDPKTGSPIEERL
jgi:hypothetical protein